MASGDFLAQCDVQSRDERCPNPAAYVLLWGYARHGNVCRSCLAEWLAVLTERHGKVEVERVVSSPYPFGDDMPFTSVTLGPDCHTPAVR